MKNLPNSLEKENKKLVQISEAALILGVSIDTLRRWDKKDILKASRSKGRRFYSLEELERFGKKKTKYSTYATTYANEPKNAEKLDWQVFQWLSSAVESVKKAQVRLLSFNKFIKFSVLMPLVMFLAVIFIVSFLFLLKPRATTEFFDYKLKSQILDNKKQTAAVLAAQTTGGAVANQNVELVSKLN